MPSARPAVSFCTAAVNSDIFSITGWMFSGMPIFSLRFCSDRTIREDQYKRAVPSSERAAYTGYAGIKGQDDGYGNMHLMPMLNRS